MRQAICIGLLAVSLLTGCSCRKSDPEAALAPPAGGKILTEEQKNSPLIQWISVRPQPFRKTLQAVGSIASDAEKVTQIHVPTPGRIARLLASVGDVVEKGQGLLRYAPDGGGEKEIRAPEHGVVLGLYADQGDHLDPVVPVITIADTTHLRAVLDIYEKDIGKVSKGQKALLKVTAYPQTFQGTLAYISPRVDENTRTIKIRVDVENPEEKLKFGMFVTASIILSEHEALVVPETAIQQVDGKPVVLVLQGGNAVVPRPVEIGEKIDGQVEILSGLKEGEVVVGQGSFILKNG